MFPLRAAICPLLAISAAVLLLHRLRTRRRRRTTEQLTRTRPAGYDQAHQELAAQAQAQQ